MRTTWPPHLFGFGGAGGALFKVLCRQGTPQSVVAQGIGFGILVWGISYSGWIPALGILPPPPKDEQPRQLVMLAAHWVYGGMLGGCVAWLDREGIEDECASAE